MTRSRLTLAALASLGVLVAAGCGGGGGSNSGSTSSGKVPADAVARVDGQPVLRSELDQLLERAKASYKQQKRQFPQVGSTEYQALQQQAVSYLVRRTEYEQQAKALKVAVTSTDVDKRLVQIRKQFFSGSEKKLEAGIKAQGYTLASFRGDIGSQLLSEKLVAVLTKDVKVTAADVKAYYAKNTAQYSVPESRTVRHILVKTKAEAEKIYAQLKQGASFAALAKKYSLDTQSAKDGGKLTIQRGQTVAPFDTTAFLLAPGQISRPVKTQFGWHVIEPVSAITPARTKPLSSVRQDIRKTLLDQRRSNALQAWVAKVNALYAKKVAYATGFAPPAQATTPSTTTG